MHRLYLLVFELLILAILATKATAWTLPIDNPRLTNGFWECRVKCYHLGDDYVPQNNLADHNDASDTVVRSIGAGRVVEVNINTSRGNYGGRVLVQHETATGPIVAIYGHLGSDTDDPLTDDISVAVGDDVVEGEELGRLGTRDENGGFIPHLHLGIHKGSYAGNSLLCNRWIYAGYADGTYESDNHCFCDVYNGWYDPSEFLGLRTSPLQIIDGEVNPNEGPVGTEYTWHLRARGRSTVPIQARVNIWNPMQQREFPFVMNYIAGSSNPYEFEYSGRLQNDGTYGYRFEIQACDEIAQEADAHNGPQSGGNANPTPPPAPPPSDAGTPPAEEACIPSPEVCDGRDNDCDLVTDNNLEGWCTTICEQGQRRCENGQWTACSARQPTPETCNNIDDDCDGPADEGIVNAVCYNACGNAGVHNCQAGTWTPCNARQCDPNPPADNAPPPAAAPPPADQQPAGIPTPSNTGPADNQIIGIAFENQGTTRLSWSRVQNAASYDYMVNFGGSQGGQIASGNTAETNAPLTVERGSYGTQIVWKVRARANNGETSPWSAPWSLYFTHPLGSIIRCESNLCPAAHAWYKVSRDLNAPGGGDLPILMTLDYINAQCSAGLVSRPMIFGDMSGYHRSNRFNGCPP